MLLYTIQTYKAWVQLKTHGKYVADFHKSDFLYGQNKDDEYPQGIFAYKWLMDQYKTKSGVKIDSMVWAWSKYHDKTDLFNEPMRKYYPNQAMLKLDVPGNLVLLSDFYLWNRCLNFGYIGEDEQDEDAFYSYCDAMDEDTYTSKVTESWQRIFNTAKSPSVQAMIPYIDKQWVKAVQIRRNNHKTKVIKLQKYVVIFYLTEKAVS